MSVGKRIKERRKELGLNADQLADKVGVSRSTIFRYEKGEIEKMGPDVLGGIAKALNTSPAVLMGWEENIDRPEIVALYSKLNPERQEKVLDYTKAQLEEQNKVVSIFDVREDDSDYVTDYVEGLVAAGHGAYQEDNLHMEVRLRANDVPSAYDTIAKVAGDSMEPLIHDNDLLFIKVSSQVEVNDIGIFQINGKNFVKKLRRDYDGRWYLQSLNNRYEEITLTEDDDIRTIGEVVEIYRTN
ncbi:TPA: helix-turn-helix domain-containing protein [Streptococcus suis]